MDTLNQIAQDILGIVRAKRVDDYNVSAAQVKRWISYTRAQIIKNELNKKQAVDEDFIQDLGCVDLEKVPDAACGPSCIVLRTCKLIPNPIITNLGLAITRVGPVKRLSRAFSFVPYNQAQWSGNGRFANKEVFAYYLNGYIYIKITKDHVLAKAMKLVNIRGVFEDPENVSEFSQCGGSPCYGNETKYPVKKAMINPIINQILEERFGIVEQSTLDSKNDEGDTKEV
jgi:hypothetical protein